MDHHLPQPTRPEQFMPAMLLLLACSAPPVPRDCGQSPLWNVGQGMALLPGHCVFIGALALGITGSHQPQQGTLLPAAHPSKLGATLAAGTSQKRCAGSMWAACERPVRLLPGHGGQAGGRGHPTQLRAASRGLGKACVSL